MDKQQKKRVFEMSIRIGQKGVTTLADTVPEPIDDMPLRQLENPIII